MTSSESKEIVDSIVTLEILFRQIVCIRTKVVPGARLGSIVLSTSHSAELVFWRLLIEQILLLRMGCDRLKGWMRETILRCVTAHD